MAAAQTLPLATVSMLVICIAEQPLAFTALYDPPSGSSGSSGGSSSAPAAPASSAASAASATTAAPSACEVEPTVYRSHLRALTQALPGVLASTTLHDQDAQQFVSATVCMFKCAADLDTVDAFSALAAQLQTHQNRDVILRLLLAKPVIAAAVSAVAPSDSALDSAADTAQLAQLAVACRELCQNRVQMLGVAEPVFSWRMPLASMPTHPEVELFLRSEKECFTEDGLTDIRHARNFVNKYCTGGYINGYSIRGEAGGRGNGAFVNIHKTHSAFKEQLRCYSENQEERSRLKALLGSEEPPSPSSPRKRQRLSAGEDVVEDEDGEVGLAESPQPSQSSQASDFS
jgi:hypothetical protein